MKKITLTLAFIFSIALVNAQEVKPKFEKVDTKVKATYYHDNGEIAQTGYFADGKLDGEWKMYNDTGKKIAEGNYTEGKKTGKWFFWNNDKSTLSEVDYKNSEIVNVTQWNNKGTLVVRTP